MAAKRWLVGDIYIVKVDANNSFIAVLRESPMVDFLDVSDPDLVNCDIDIERYWIFRIWVDNTIFRKGNNFLKVKRIRVGQSEGMQTFRYDDIEKKYFLLKNGFPKGEATSKEIAELYERAAVYSDIHVINRLLDYTKDKRNYKKKIIHRLAPSEENRLAVDGEGG